MIDKDELKKLNPRKRIKKLKEMHDEREKESSEIDKLIKESEQEAKTDTLADEIAPQARDVDIADLFDKQEDSLDSQVKVDAPPEGGIDTKYAGPEQQYSDYETLKDLLPTASSGNLDENQLLAIDEIGERLENITYKTESKRVADVHVASIALHHKIRKYQGLD
tara:strand:- start:301 stop:795 length:495 start_codon:yes stop_codon:yes gene_type:complete